MLLVNHLHTTFLSGSDTFRRSLTLLLKRPSDWCQSSSPKIATVIKKGRGLVKVM